MTQPLVSVIVPCYQAATTLCETLRSVQRQKFRDWECLIVNDGSTDETSAIARRWEARDCRFRVIEKTNGGPSSARNVGIRASRGEFLNFLDADDLLYRNALVGFLRGAKERLDADVYYTGFDVIDEDGRYLSTRSSPSNVSYATLCQGTACSGNRFPPDPQPQSRSRRAARSTSYALPLRGRGACRRRLNRS